MRGTQGRPLSLIERLLSSGLTPRQLHDALTPQEREALHFLWRAWARPTVRLDGGEYTGQLAPPGQWATWEVLAGRAFGKTRLAAEWVREKRAEMPGSRGALVGATAKETRKVMVKGESGILSCCPPWDRPHFNVTDQCLEWADGTVAFLYSADVPDAFRGPQHHWAWVDEPAKFRRLLDTFDNLMMGLRLGANPQMLLTTTPRPLKLLRELKKQATTACTVGTTFDNAGNLPRSYIDQMIARYAGTTLGRQELMAELFDDVPGALWQRAWIEAARVQTNANTVEAKLQVLEEQRVRLVRIAVGVDPSLNDKAGNDEAGIGVAGIDDKGHVYVLEDASLKATPDKWGRRAVKCYHDWHASVMREETTRGGKLVASVVKLIDQNINLHTTGGNKDKIKRAEPVAALYEQGKVHHVGIFQKLEDQMCTYTPETKKSPNNMDAMVHAIAELAVNQEPAMVFV
jgi:phage terminase large subunit-like protein